MEWRTEIIEGYASDLSTLLTQLTLAGYVIKTILPNGVNRWTVIAYKGDLDADRHR